MDHAALKARIASGLLSFPVSPFRADLSFDLERYRAHVGWLAGFEAAALFAAGGTGEFFSLTPAEVCEATRAAKEVSGAVPIIAGCGYGTAMACELAEGVERAGADAILLLPHYLVGASQEGLFAHVKAVCGAIRIGVVVYNRDNAILKADTLARLAEACPNLIGFKDGSGDIATVRQVTASLGDRLVYIGGMPTHELYAEAYDAAGVSTYSSAIFNFAPEMALTFHRALGEQDRATLQELLTGFFYPYSAIRDRSPGYAVSIIKAGLRLAGRDCGPVRPPLTDLTEVEHELLAPLVRAHCRG
ncbi:MAG: 5-dehydro-4-deoxyglucarate dehydratase [Tistlia sp.]|uniref:5-dehydro-4-deoxyglucarate dehydratase n=1 Tax=Tistlia sp. TaxID=3057121 RepID=UPI0034A1BFD9